MPPFGSTRNAFSQPSWRKPATASSLGSNRRSERVISASLEAVSAPSSLVAE